MMALTEQQIDAAVDIALGRYPQRERIDWDELLYRVEAALGVDLPGSMLDPEVRRLQRAVRAALSEAWA